MTGPIVDIADRMDDAIDVVVSGHTHQAYNCEIDGKLVTSASSFGRLVTDIDLQIDRRTGDVITAAAEQRHRHPDVADGPGADRADRPLPDGPRPDRDRGRRRPPQRDHPDARRPSSVRASGESPLGNLIADAQLAATDDEENAVAALHEPGRRPRRPRRRRRSPTRRRSRSSRSPTTW